MKRRSLRGVLMAALVVSAVFAAWSWFRPYEWGADTAAGCRIVGAQVRRDRSNYWVDLHLKMVPGRTHDLMKPVILVTAAGNGVEPADTTLGGDVGNVTNELWLKFWLETADMEGTLNLRINDGHLLVKSTSGTPGLGASGVRYFVTNHW